MTGRLAGLVGRDGAGHRAALGLIAAMAFLVRLLHVVTFDQAPIYDMNRYIGDAIFKLSLERLFQPEGIVSVPPGYSLFIKPFFLIFDQDAALHAIRIAHALLGAWTCIVIYRIARMIHSRRAGLLAAAAACFYPHFLFYSSFILSEALFIPLYFTVIAVCLRCAGHPSPRTQLLAGLLTAAAILVRPVAVSAAPAALLAVWRSGSDSRGRLRALALMAAAGAAVIGPWTARNFIASGRFIPIAPASTYNLVIGNNPTASGSYGAPPQRAGDRYATEDDWRRMIREFVTGDPMGEIFLITRLKWQAFWNVQSPSGLMTINPSLYAGRHYFPFISWRWVMVLGLLGCGALVARGGSLAWSTPLCLALYVAFYMAFFGSPRFRLPCEGFFLAWTGIGLAVMIERTPGLRSWKTGRLAGALSMGLLLIVGISLLEASGTRRSLADPGAVLAAREAMDLDPGAGAVLLFREASLPVDRRRGRYMELRFEARRERPSTRRALETFISFHYRNAEGRRLKGIESPYFELDGIHHERFTDLAVRFHIPPAARMLELYVNSDAGNPEIVRLRGITLRYSAGSDLLGEFLYPYLDRTE